MLSMNVHDNNCSKKYDNVMIIQITCFLVTNIFLYPKKVSLQNICILIKRYDDVTNHRMRVYFDFHRDMLLEVCQENGAVRQLELHQMMLAVTHKQFLAFSILFYLLFIYFIYVFILVWFFAFTGYFRKKKVKSDMSKRKNL